MDTNNVLANLKVVSFFAEPEKDSTYYTRGATELKKSCLYLGLDYHIERLESRGGYYANTFLKPGFIRRFDGPILWIDADSVLFKKPTIPLGADFAAYQKTGHLPIFSHALFFSGSPKSKELVEIWFQLSQKREEEWKGSPKTDHDSLVEAMNQTGIKPEFFSQKFVELKLAPKTIIKSKCLRF